MQTIFLATDESGWCGMYFGGNAPMSDGHCFRSRGGDYSQWPCPNRPPPGECREYRLVPVEELTDDDAGRVKDKIIDNLRSKLKELENDAETLRQQIELMHNGSKARDQQIEALERQLAARSPGVMPDVVAELVDWTDDVDSSDSLRKLSRSVREYYAPPAGHEWQPVDDANPITAADVGRQVWVPDGNETTVQVVDGDVMLFSVKQSHKVSHILRPIAPPFVFTGEPGLYQTNNCGVVSVILNFDQALVLFADNHYGPINPDGTFDGGVITGRVE